MLDTIHPIVKEYSHAFLFAVRNLPVHHEALPAPAIKWRQLSAMSEQACDLGENRVARAVDGMGALEGWEPAYKPGSVEDSHSSRTRVTARLKRPTRGHAWATRRGAGPLAPLFGLAPGGVYPATDVATGAVRYYRTISPLPPAIAPKPRWRGWRYLFCGTFRGLAPPRRYLAPCPVEPGLSSPPN